MTAISSKLWQLSVVTDAFDSTLRQEAAGLKASPGGWPLVASPAVGSPSTIGANHANWFKGLDKSCTSQNEFLSTAYKPVEGLGEFVRLLVFLFFSSSFAFSLLLLLLQNCLHLLPIKKNCPNKPPKFCLQLLICSISCYQGASFTAKRSRVI